MRGWLLIAWIAGCDAPTIRVTPADAAVEVAAEAATDASPCESVRSIDPDVGICSGHDEDRDCLPDLCDDCPGVPGDPTKLGRDPLVAGALCIHPDHRSATRRIFYSAFEAGRGPFRDYSEFPLAGETFRVEDGVAKVGSNLAALRFGVAAIDASAKTVVATGVVRVDEVGGSALFLLRARGDSPRAGFGCGIVSNTSGSGFGLREFRCDGPAMCGLRDVTAGGAPLPVKPLPLDVSLDRFLLRASVTDDASGAIVRCQVFPVPKNADDAARTLGSIVSESHTVTHTFPKPADPGTGVGILARDTSASVEWIDVIGEP